MSRDPDALIDTGQRLNRWVCGMRLKRIQAGRRSWPYLDGGKGEVVVLLHGFGADKDRFGAFLPMIRRGFRVVVPDLPGFGDQQQLWDAGYDIASQIRRLERFIASLGLQRFHLMGVSLGGYLAACYAAKNTRRVRSLCLMDAAGFSSPIESDALRLFENGQRNIFLPADGAGMQLLMDYLLYRRVVLPQALRRYWLNQVLDLLPWRQKLFDDLLAGGLYLMDDLAGAITAPTLVIWGAEDRICHVSTVETIMARIDNSRSYIIHGCGHIPLVEFPFLSARIYRNFLRSFR